MPSEHPSNIPPENTEDNVRYLPTQESRQTPSSTPPEYGFLSYEEIVEVMRRQNPDVDIVLTPTSKPKRKKD